MEDTRLYHSPDLKPVCIKTGEQCISNPPSILTFPSRIQNPILTFFLSGKCYDFRSKFICLVSTVYHLSCWTTVPENSLVLTHFVLVNTNKKKKIL